MEEKNNDECCSQKNNSKKIKNLISLSILLGGLFIGSLFVDVAQLIKGSGFSQRMLDKSDVFNSNGKTWVAFDEPIIKVQVLTDDACEKCNPEEAVVGLKREFPTMLTQKIDINSDEGKDFQKKFEIKTIPAFVFSNEVEKTIIFSQAKAAFTKVENSYVLSSTAVGLPVGKYIETPSVSDNDINIGSRDAKVKVIEFSDFQCPYCRKSHEEVVSKILKEYGDKVLYVFKPFPLENIHPQSRNAVLAAECANEQGKFGQYSDKLFTTQDAWGKVSGTVSFKSYAKQIGINGAQFDQCLDSKKFDDRINASIEEARNFGISGTPALFINDQVVSGLPKYDDVKKIIDEQLSK